MSRLFRLAGFALLPLAIALFAAGCHNNAASVQADNNQADTQNPASDPATANLAPVPDNSGTISYQQSAPPDQSSYDPSYGEQPEYTSAQPPPPLPDYDQPQCPGDDYIWTPGYWAWSPDGYYWVPGAWIEAPYEGALWTPGYWGFWDNVYGFYPGYWGQYIGYYGGINYGFGYVGYGYQGGYWGGGHFYYNRSVNNVNVSLVHNVYSRSVAGNTNGPRVSYNGGSGGVRAPARPAELAAMRQPHTAPMTSQVQNQRTASTNRAQFVSTNHGRPANVAVSKPLAADRNVKAPAALQKTNRAVEQQQQHQAPPQQQQHQAGPQQQHQAAPQERQAVPQEREAAPQQHRAAPQQRQTAPQERQAVPQERQAAPPQQRQTAPQQRQAAPQQQRQAAPQQRQAAPQQQHRAAPQQRQAAPQPQRQAAPQQRQTAPQPQHQAAPKQDEQHPK
ncbi:MAG: YXWGXW repeat-containing protein [Terracidiphilus sp.]